MLFRKCHHSVKIFPILLCRHSLLRIRIDLRKRAILGDCVRRSIPLIPFTAEIVYLLVIIAPFQFRIAVMRQRIRSKISQKFLVRHTAPDILDLIQGKPHTAHILDHIG